MAITLEGNYLVVDSSVHGSLFPKSESELSHSVLIDATRTGKPIVVGGALYARSLTIRGDVSVEGPIVCRGDIRLEPKGARVKLLGGVNTNGSLVVVEQTEPPLRAIRDGIANAACVIRGDLAINQNVLLAGTVLFGSVHALNCMLDDCVVLGTSSIKEQLTVRMSTIAGYVARDITFEGACGLIHALGESASQPVFAPAEFGDTVVAPDVRFYPAVRSNSGLMNIAWRKPEDYSDHSRLYARTDWLRTDAWNKVIGNGDPHAVSKFVLSLGGRIGDFSGIQNAIEAMTVMLKCGFEYEHYEPSQRARHAERARVALTPEEAWILSEVCN